MSAQKWRKLRGQSAKAQSSSALAALIRDTSRLWRKHHLSYDQTKYIVEQVRHRLNMAAPSKRRRTVERLDRNEVERLIGSAYQNRSQEGLLIKTLFLTGTRVSEFVHIRVEDLCLESDPAQIISPGRKAARIGTRLFYRHWRRSYVRIFNTGVKGGCSKATAIKDMRCEAYRQWSKGVQSERESPRESTHICCVTPLRRFCSIPARCRSTRCKSFWDTSTCPQHKSMRKQACRRSPKTMYGL
jgi:integrase